MKIAIQGIKGSFHHIVASQYFGDNVNVEECDSFPELVSALDQPDCTHAVMAIENSIAGAILPNYALLYDHKLQIEGEYYLSVQHHLMALQGTSISAIKEVYSHPMAILQCRAFFDAYPHIKLIEDTDTAGVARRINQNQLEGVGAIASATAAQLNDLKILSKSIQTIKDNATRFFILNKSKHLNEVVNKATLRFVTDHKRGSLATILNVLSDCKLNLTKIQSLPVIETPWKYAFFVDVTFDAVFDFEKASKVLAIMATDFEVLGTYKNTMV